MVEFLKTEGISFRLSELIHNTKQQLILISPYLKMSLKIQESLENKDRDKIDIRFIFRKSDLQPDQMTWLKSHPGIRTSYRENLHAKCYINEGAAIITSMNLYEFSQQHNDEMGIYVTKEGDKELYESIQEEVQTLLKNSKEYNITVEEVIPKSPSKESTSTSTKQDTRKSTMIGNEVGHCIRCNKQIKLNPEYPYCPDCYKIWMRKDQGQKNHAEKFCHACGEENRSTFDYPMDRNCYGKHKDLFPPKTTGGSLKF